MALCTSFVNNVECALALQNDYNIKLLIIGFVLLLSVASLMYHKYFNPDKSYSNVFIHYSLKVLPMMYIVSTSFLLFMLRHNISLEIFILAYVGVALLLSGLVTVISIIFGVEYAFKLAGVKMMAGDYSQSQKYKSTNKKYG